MDLETHSSMDYVDQFIGITGSVSPLYASGTALARAGIVFGLDMTTEGSSRSFLFPPTASFFTSHFLRHKTPSLALFCPLILEITLVVCPRFSYRYRHCPFPRPSTSLECLIHVIPYST